MDGRPPSRSLNHRQIEAFRAAMAGGSARAAANLLHVTQPAVSRLIAQLEWRVGFSLFERRKRGLQPTKDGLLLFEEVTRSFRGLDRITEVADAIRSRKFGRLRVIALHAFCDGMVSRAVGRFLMRNSGVYVELETGAREAVTQGVASGNFDIGITKLPVPDTGVTSMLICEHEAVCIVQAGHRLSRRRALTAREVAGERFLALPLGSDFRAAVDYYFADRGSSLNIVAEARTQRALGNLVAAGAGLSVIDPTVAMDFRCNGVVAIPLKPALQWSVGAILPSRQAQSLTLTALLSELGVKGGQAEPAAAASYKDTSYKERQT